MSDKMSKEEKIRFYATAPRATVGTISQIVDRDFRTYFVGKLRGRIVSGADGEYRHSTKEAALECARWFRRMAREEAAKAGIAV